MIGSETIDTYLDRLASHDILQTPLPAGVAAGRLVGHIARHKDADGANPVSLGRLAVGEPASLRPQ